jgi:hypothetical protein
MFVRANRLCCGFLTNCARFLEKGNSEIIHYIPHAQVEQFCTVLDPACNCNGRQEGRLVKQESAFHLPSTTRMNAFLLLAEYS